MTQKIAYIAGQFPLRSETFVYREVRELRRRGWDVTCISLRPTTDAPESSDDLTTGLITVYDPQTPPSGLGLAALPDAIFPGESVGVRDRAKLIYQARVASGLARRLQELSITHIHAHFAHAPATIGMYAAMAMNIPFSFTGHANDLFQRRALLKRKLQRAKFVSCISEEHRKLYNSIHPRSDTAYPIIRCGVDIASFNIEPRTPNPISKILTVCRLVEKKGVDTLIRAFAQLDTDAELLIAGDGPQRAELEQIASTSGKAGQVHFLGAVSNERVRALLQSSDIFALPCRVDRNGDKDGIPVVLMEAMACGLPVISGDLPAIRELVIHDQTGLLVDGSQLEPTADALRRLLNDPDVATRLGVGGRDRVTHEFALTENVSRLERAINQP
jgi:glycosyltransferase involved in cell wall biosynthesis